MIHSNFSVGDMAVILSKLTVFASPSIREEQYPTDSQIAASWLVLAAQLGDIRDKRVLDLGGGTGVLGIAAALQGAKKVVIVEKDENALKIAQENYEGLKQEFPFMNVEFVKKKIEEINDKADTIIQNPPFGTKQKHADKAFLEKAFLLTDTVYSMHKTSTARFVESIAKDYTFSITHTWKFEMPLKATQSFHKSKIRRIEVAVWRLQKKLKADTLPNHESS